MAIKVNGKKVAGRGVPGPQGKSAYQAASENGYTGTETEYNLALSEIDRNTRKSFEFTVTVPADGWSNGMQVVQSEHLIADGYSYVIYPNMNCFLLYIESGVRADDVSEDGSIRFRCDTAPDRELSVSVLRVAVDVPPPKIYGAEWDGTSRTD